MDDVPHYQINREFDAPRPLVWRAWTDPKLLSHWYGPGVDTTIHAFDLRPGGEWRNEMRWGEKSDLSKMVFIDVVPLEKLVWRHSSTDRAWNIVSNPMMPDWPQVLLTTVTFADKGAGTEVRLTVSPVEATEAEIACFAGAMAGLDKGWGSGFSVLEKMLAELQA